MLIDIQPDAATPIFEQIVHQITHAIASGVLEPETIIPSVRELAEEQRVHPNTVARAYQELERRGLVEVLRGKGTAVATKGPQLAQQQRQDSVRERIRQALREARLALPPEELRQVVEEELAQFNGKTTSRGKR